MTPEDKKSLELFSARMRRWVIEGVYNAKSGHPGGSLSCTDIICYLYNKVLNVDPKNPSDPDRDRFVLSKGHCAPALYSALGLKGFFDVNEIKNLRKIGSFLQGHPCKAITSGIDMSTGSLGQGISVAVGMALSAKLQGKDYRVYTLLGDGECQEGQVWEAMMFAGHRKLDNLCIIIDNNNLQIDGDIRDICSPHPLDDKARAFNCHPVVVEDGNDMEQIAAAFKEARETKGCPTVIIAKTLKGKGVSFMEGQASWHGKAPNDEQFAQAMKELEEVQ